MEIVNFEMMIVVIKGIMGLRKMKEGMIFEIKIEFENFNLGVVMLEKIRSLVENMDVEEKFKGRV